VQQPISNGQSRTGAEEADGRQPSGLLRARRDRPRRCAAEQRDERATTDVIAI